MSAYLCDDKHISQVAEFLCYHAGTFHPSFWRQGWTAERIGKELHSMNCEALRQRYEDREFPEFVYVASPLAVPLGQSLKSMECLRYQCSEGDVPKTELYKQLSRAIESLTGELLKRDCREYAGASWGAYEPPKDQPQVYQLSKMIPRRS